MKILSMEGQAAVFLMTAATGFGIGFIYDIFRLFRKIIPHRNLAARILIQAEDVLFWTVASFLTFYVLLYNDYGRIRAFNIIGAGLGAVLYFTTLSVLFMAASNAIINFIRKVAEAIIKLVCAPFRALFKIAKIPARLIRKTAKKTGKNIKKPLRKVKKYAKIKAKGVRREINIIHKKA